MRKLLINVNVDTQLKEDATNILKGLGLNMSTAINMFLTQVVKRDAIPFEIVNPKPSKEMLQALQKLKICEKILINIHVMIIGKT